ncbi:COG1940 Transcriptional regulator sugar kinase [Vibrio sp. B1FIG11]|nr:COG1940 Transcriptional regulator sugar kinase [Vibrio sp. B1FIG11]CAE6898683.1 COG1940 Transcriptional regulator sugar kinase [Vibrio sp. B1FIG11]CAE6912828.1 COG1940 Transcriptional regulator sugar kinase [Vibrio sp. B1FIG11]
MYMAQPGHIDHIKQVNAGRVYKLIDLKVQYLESICPSKVSLRLRVSLRSLES